MNDFCSRFSLKSSNFLSYFFDWAACLSLRLSYMKINEVENWRERQRDEKLDN